MTGGRRRRSSLAGALLLAAALAGCNVELYGGLTQREANEMVAVLAAAGVAASREETSDDRYAILVDESVFAEAVAALERRGLPRERFQTMCEVFSDDSGWAPSPTHERARMTCALGQELSRTVSEIDGVANARVHLVLPSVDLLSRERAEASASVAIHLHPGFDEAALAARVKLLVANAVEGLAYERVSIVLFPANGLSAPAPATPPVQLAAPTPAPRLGSGVILVVAAVLAAAGALLYGLLSGRTPRGGRRRS